MSVTTAAHPLDNGAEQLDQVAKQLFGKNYILLSDMEASAVWDAIEAAG